MQRRPFLIVCAALCFVQREQIALSAETVPWRELATTVDRVAKQRRLTDAALVAQSDVTAILAAVEATGWKPNDAATMLQATLPDGHLMVKKLRSPNGRAMAVKLATMPGGFDRFEHLSRLPDAPVLLDRLVDGPDGYLLIDYMINDPNGKAVGAELSEAPGGKGFNQSTGRIYTLQQFRERLEQSHRGLSDKARTKRKA